MILKSIFYVLIALAILTLLNSVLLGVVLMRQNRISVDDDMVEEE